MKLNIRAKLYAGFGVALVIMGVLSFVAYSNIENLTTTAEDVSHTHEVLNELTDILGTLKDAETGQRGFVITGEDRYLEPFLAAQEAIEHEIEHVREHPVRGYEICCHLKSLSPTLSIIRNHHERFDGCGHPDKFAAEGISLPARIASIADSYDAMTTDRPYRKGMKVDVAVDIFSKERDMGQWDPHLVDEFVKLIRTRL